MKRASRLFAVIALASMLSLVSVAQARTMDSDDNRPSALAMFGDAVFVRPVMLAATVGGVALYAVTLPFSVLGGNEGEVADTLVKTPAYTTFMRCMGCTPQQDERLEARKRTRAMSARQDKNDDDQ